MRDGSEGSGGRPGPTCRSRPEPSDDRQSLGQDVRTPPRVVSSDTDQPALLEEALQDASLTLCHSMLPSARWGARIFYFLYNYRDEC